jgi:hypothetical protein
MNKIALAALLATTVFSAGHVSAQGIRATGTAAAQAASASQSASGSIAQGGSVTINNPDRIEYSGSYEQRDVPGVIAPALAAGVNACAVSASVGGSVLGTGLTGGAAWSDKSCERRAEAAVLAGLGYPEVALRHIARDPEVFQTLVDAGLIVSAASVTAPPAGINPKQGQVVAGGYSGQTTAAALVCRVKPGTTRTIITNWPDRMACAASLGKR